MFIVLGVSALVFVVGLSIMMRSEDRCMKRSQPAAMFCRKPTEF